MDNEKTYLEVKPSIELEAFVHSFWMHINSSDKPEVMQTVIVSVKKYQSIIRFVKDYLDETEFIKN